MPLTFLDRARYVDAYDGLTFQGTDEDDKQVRCHLHIAALRDHFALEQGATGHILAVFDENRDAIEAVAARKFAQGEIETERGIVLSSDDFQ